MGGRLLGRRAYYGWVIAGTLSLTETVSWGIVYYAFSAFLLPMRQELGWTTSEITGAYSLALLVAGLAAVPAGRWVDRHGARALMTAGSVVAVLLMLAWAAVDSLLGLYLIWAGLGLAMAAILYEPAFTVIATWFDRDRGRAMLLLTFFAGFASTIFLPLATVLVDGLGWRRALVTLAVILAVTTVPAHAIVLRRRPEDLGLRPDGAPTPTVDSPGPRSHAPPPPLPADGGSDFTLALGDEPDAGLPPDRVAGLRGNPAGDRPHAVPPETTGLDVRPAPETHHGSRGQAGHTVTVGASDRGAAPGGNGSPAHIDGTSLRDALRGTAFWWLSAAFWLGTLTSIAAGVHLIPFLVEGGTGAGFAATAAGLIGATQVGARVVVVLLGERWSQVAVTAVVFAFQAASLVVLLLWRDPAGVIVAVVLLGAGRGALTLTRAGLVADLYGRAHYGAINGALALVSSGARAMAPVGAGLAYGWWGGYPPVFWGLAAASALASLAMLGVPGWRR